MGWITSLYRSSIGKKSIMAASGLLLCLFLLAHLLGNSVSFLGREAFNTYAEKLHTMDTFLFVFEIGLLALFLIHIITAVLLYLENLQARPARYAVSRSGGGRSPGSRTMPYTGVIILVFIVVHLLNFHFTDKSIPVADLVRGLLSRPALGMFYIFSLLAVALHLSHGVWSLFQSVGFNHDKYNQVLFKGALIFSIVVGAVFILIPFLALVSRNFLL
ncbi:MAG: succinate dehydrogenase cytochrome b subunit [Desulfobulbales bacterium]|nr:succinate dehydrogenase cytochrome b subunit [Desulfobulbales bacterium]